LTPAKEDLKAEVKESKSTATEGEQKNKKVEEGFLWPRFCNIAAWRLMC